ncbi:hypothetical protein K0504_14525 [Neiella marina]|uniref:Uncharacterized protein n=1 Tax=Neiella holothuriorum TaxID=2870530 RepID=A0ABS7EIS6_9GAMM|nr:hypothetical protein [Neiella holothuriorum]MBW8192249.1 hypothetical protein [Neiella holothuriorum]
MIKVKSESAMLNTKANKRQIATYRYRNARYILFERCQGEVARFARYLQQSHSYASAYISESPTKRIGDKVARMMEQAFSLETSWLDSDRSQRWDQRLRDAIGGGVHPLDQQHQDSPELDHQRWLSQLAVLPESGPQLIQTGFACQQRLAQIQQQVEQLNRLQRAILAKSTQLYERDLESQLLGLGYVVQPPSQEQGAVFRIWHGDPAIKLCLQLRVALAFEPVLQLTPLPPAVKEVIAIPFVEPHSHQPSYIFMAADARSSRFDASRLKWIDNALWLMGVDGSKQRDMTSALRLDPLFQQAN